MNEKENERHLLIVEMNEHDRIIEELNLKETSLKEELNKKMRIAKKLEETIKNIIYQEGKSSRSAKTVDLYKQLSPEEKLLSQRFRNSKGRLPWPIKKGIITSSFGEQPHPVLRNIKIRNNGIDIIIVDTDGNHEAITPLFLEGGVNCLYPLEVAANMDAVVARKKYGKQLRLAGNIDKRTLIDGKEAIKKEVNSKLPFLVKDLGYIPSVDHCVPADVPFEHFEYYVRLLREHIRKV